jgi:hypothetical protein
MEWAETILNMLCYVRGLEILGRELTSFNADETSSAQTSEL